MIIFKNIYKSLWLAKLYQRRFKTLVLGEGGNVAPVGILAPLIFYKTAPSRKK